MNRFFAFIFVITILLAGCSIRPSERTYENGYSDGYQDAQSEVEILLLTEYEKGYEDGYEEAYVEPSHYEYEAVEYAEKHSSCHPEEALYIIQAYQNQEAMHDGVIPCEEDYRMAIESLSRFYDYFYNGMYN